MMLRADRLALLTHCDWSISMAKSGNEVSLSLSQVMIAGHPLPLDVRGLGNVERIVLETSVNLPPTGE